MYVTYACIYSILFLFYRSTCARGSEAVNGHSKVYKHKLYCTILASRNCFHAQDVGHIDIKFCPVLVPIVSRFLERSFWLLLFFLFPYLPSVWSKHNSSDINYYRGLNSGNKWSRFQSWLVPLTSVWLAMLHGLRPRGRRRTPCGGLSVRVGRVRMASYSLPYRLAESGHQQPLPW